MNPTLHAYESARVYSINRNTCLYRDHEGRRVIADVEGSGYYTADEQQGVRVFVDEAEVFERRGVFQSSFTVVARDDLSCGAMVYEGRQDITNFNKLRSLVEKVTLPFEGCGWFLDSFHPVLLDGRHGRNVFLGCPLPFFQSITGAGDAWILRSSPRALLKLDSFSIGDATAMKERGVTAQNISSISVLDSTFADKTPHKAEVASHLNAFSWNLTLPGMPGELMIRRTFDAFHGRQRARVLIDGEVAGIWYEAGQQRIARWAENRFGVRPRLTEGKKSVRVTIDPVASSPLWSVSEIECFWLHDVGDGGG